MRSVSCSEGREEVMSRFNRKFCSILIFNLFLKIDATCSTARITKFGCNLITRKDWLPLRYFNPRTSRSRTEQIYS